MINLTDLGIIGLILVVSYIISYVINIKKIYRLLENSITYDPWDNFSLDLSNKIINLPTWIIRMILTILIKKEEARITKHAMTIKIGINQHNLISIVSNKGFTVHHAKNDYILFIKCLLRHIENCPYPKYCTLTVGVTAIVFNQDLSKVLVVKEKIGIDQFKPVTGQVEYGKESDNTPLDAVVREIYEELGIVLKKSDASLVAIWWGNKYRGNIPDVNFAYAFKVLDLAPIRIQEKEISNYKWTYLNDYINQTWIEKETPCVGKIVSAAHKTLTNGMAWSHETCFLSINKPAFLSFGKKVS